MSYSLENMKPRYIGDSQEYQRYYDMVMCGRSIRELDNSTCNMLMCGVRQNFSDARGLLSLIRPAQTSDSSEIEYKVHDSQVGILPAACCNGDYPEIATKEFVKFGSRTGFEFKAQKQWKECDIYKILTTNAQTSTGGRDEVREFVTETLVVAQANSLFHYIKTSMTGWGEVYSMDENKNMVADKCIETLIPQVNVPSSPMAPFFGEGADPCGTWSCIKRELKKRFTIDYRVAFMNEVTYDTLMDLFEKSNCAQGFCCETRMTAFTEGFGEVVNKIKGIEIRIVNSTYSVKPGEIKHLLDDGEMWLWSGRTGIVGNYLLPNLAKPDATYQNPFQGTSYGAVLTFHTCGGQNQDLVARYSNRVVWVWEYPCDMVRVVLWEPEEQPGCGFSISGGVQCCDDYMIGCSCEESQETEEGGEKRVATTETPQTTPVTDSPKAPETQVVNFTGEAMYITINGSEVIDLKGPLDNKALSSALAKLNYKVSSRANGEGSTLTVTGAQDVFTSITTNTGTFEF